MMLLSTLQHRCSSHLGSHSSGRALVRRDAQPGAERVCRLGAPLEGFLQLPGCALQRARDLHRPWALTVPSKSQACGCQLSLT